MSRSEDEEDLFDIFGDLEEPVRPPPTANPVAVGLPPLPVVAEKGRPALLTCGHFGWHSAATNHAAQEQGFCCESGRQRRLTLSTT